MPVPSEYQRASQDFETFLVDAKNAAALETSHQVFTMVEGVFRVFRRRLSVGDALAFAGALPPILRALFVADWDPAEPRRPFGDLETMNREVLELRPLHNFATPTAIQDVAEALRKNVDRIAFGRVLAGLPREAGEFWGAGGNPAARPA